ncbi:unnamed protein product [Lactuca saligna]|uniref:Uncharacterized protein n=1 Tax=Lactuca saligna TaxID=75948 RepID=A0AA36DYQ5_LACSI|nr:unnamed protein product [Lactuca saligna]
MAASMSSYGIIVPASRHYFIVNAQPGEDVDEIMVLDPSPTQSAMIHDSGDVFSVMSDGGPAYTTLSMEFTTNHGSVAIARFVDGSQVADDQQPMNIAKFIVLLESRQQQQQDDDHDHEDDDDNDNDNDDDDDDDYDDDDDDDDDEDEDEDDGDDDETEEGDDEVEVEVEEENYKSDEEKEEKEVKEMKGMERFA